MDEYLEELDRLFRQAVNRQLVADVPVGVLSERGDGLGLDHRSRRPSRFHSCGRLRWASTCSSASGLELAFDERTRAEHMSYLFGTEHYEMVLKAGDMERVMPRLAWHLEEPRVGQSYPNFYAAQLAGKFVKVVLSGAGRRRTVRRIPLALLPRRRQR